MRASRRRAACPYHDHTLTAACLARLVGTSKALVLSYEHGRSSPSPKRLRDLAHAIGVAPSGLQPHLQGVSDLRTAAGLTAAELADLLGLSVNTYRRIETEGLMPKRRPGVLWELIRILGVDYTRLRGALAQTPAVARRQEKTAELLTPFVEQNRQPGDFRQLQDTSVEAREIACLYQGRPAVVSKLVNLQLGNVRQLLSQRAQTQARLDYARGVPRRFVQAYEEEIAKLGEEIRTGEARIPDLLEQYLVHPLSQRCWTMLAKLYTAGPTGLDLSPSDETLMALERVFDQYLIERTATTTRLSPQGTLFCTDTLPYYRALYSEDRAVRPNMQHYGWPRIEAETHMHRHQLRTAHIFAHDPYPHWREGERIIRRSRSASSPLPE
ncbi:helix-turn-helix transcriptional regulator [Streptomyces qinglanensis]|uniref:helix-turn-helix transcriptional regulator n=1 Tax=Streptomyces qinglanensis TaxID=943816 RepID=UPI003D740736